MNILLVDDEAGIREGLATFLRLKGHGVHTAGSAAEATARLEGDAFDLVLTDWRLPDGPAQAVVRTGGCPVIAFSACPEEVESDAGLAAVLQKPVTPRRLLQEIEALASRTAARSVTVLPPDTADRIALAMELVGDPESVEIADDGMFVTLTAAVRELPDRAISQLELIGGDLCVRGHAGALRFELRLCRDGRPEGARRCHDWAGWDGRAGIVDVHGQRPPSPSEFLAILDRAARARAGGHTVSMINIAPHLRLYAEISGRGDEVPKRTRAGPRLPEVLARLWS